MRRSLHIAISLHRSLHNFDIPAFGHTFPTTTTWPPYPQPLSDSHLFPRPVAAFTPSVKSVLVLSLPVRNNDESLLSVHLVNMAACPRLVGAGITCTPSLEQRQCMVINGTGVRLSSHPSPEGSSIASGQRALDSVGEAVEAHPGPLFQQGPCTPSPAAVSVTCFSVNDSQLPPS